MAFTEQELAFIKRVAEQLGVPLEQAVEQFAKEGLAVRYRSKTGRGPAKVYDFKRRS